MTLPFPSDPAAGGANPYFQDNGFVRGDQQRANNAKIWANCLDLDSRVTTNTSNISTANTAIAVLNAALRESSNFTGIFTGNLFGFTQSYNASNKIDFAAGSARDSTDLYTIYGGAKTKQLDAPWAAGNAGGLDTGTVGNTTYHCFAIGKTTDPTAADFLFSLSATSPTMPTGWDLKRRISSIMRVSGAIIQVIQRGDEFWIYTPIRDVNVTNPGTSAVLRPLSVPLGINVKAMMNVLVGGDGSGHTGITYISSPDVSDMAASSSVAPLYTQGSYFASADGQGGYIPPIWTDTSAQVRTRAFDSGTNTSLIVVTLGWIDNRGRLY